MTEATKTPKLGKRECARIYKEAHEAGVEAVKTVKLPQFVVGQPTTPLGNDIDYTKPTYILNGLCGFAWVSIFPARGSFVTYLKSKGLGGKAYGGGYQIWVSDYGQSVDLKSAYASAFANVLQKYGIKAYGESRLD
jgi:hypothetical protein